MRQAYHGRISRDPAGSQNRVRPRRRRRGRAAILERTETTLATSSGSHKGPTAAPRIRDAEVLRELRQEAERLRRLAQWFTSLRDEPHPEAALYANEADGEARLEALTESRREQLAFAAELVSAAAEQIEIRAGLLVDRDWRPGPPKK